MDDETQLKVRKFLKRLGISSQQELNQFIENNPDVQDLSIKVSFEINDKHVFEFEDNIKKEFQMKKIQNHFISGILIVAPLALSIYVAWVVVGIADKIFRPFIPLNKFGIPSEIPGVGLIVAFLFFTILGAIAGSFFGKLYHRVVDAVLSKIPGLNSIYNTVKQIIDTFATTQSNAFKEVVLIEYPQKDMYALGFLTSETKGEIAIRKNKKMINVFMPSTPNPTTGFLMFVPLSKCIKLDMSVDQAIKYIISAGLVTPKAPEIKKALPKKKKVKKLTK